MWRARVWRSLTAVARGGCFACGAPARSAAPRDGMGWDGTGWDGMGSRLLVVLRLGGLPQRAHAREQVLRVEADLEHNLAWEGGGGVGQTRLGSHAHAHVHVHVRRCARAAVHVRRFHIGGGSHATVPHRWRLHTWRSRSLTRLEYRLDEGEVHAGEPRGDGGGSLREDRDAWHHLVRRERLLGQRAERAEANVLLPAHPHEAATRRSRARRSCGGRARRRGSGFKGGGEGWVGEGGACEGRT